MTVDSALSSGRRAAESRMSDSCTITAGGTKTWNTTTEVYDLVGGTTVYSGKCRVKSADTQALEPDAGATTAVVLRVEVDIPIGSYPGLNDGNRVHLDSAAYNPILVGADLRVTNYRFESQSTALRIVCTQEQ